MLRADPAIGPVIDIHTHVAMTHFLPLRVDVFARTPTTRYYLPVTAPIDLEPYSNANFDARALARMKRDVSLMALTSFGMRTTHTAPNLLRDMGALGIAYAVVLPIDHAWQAWGGSNAAVAAEVGRAFPRLIPFGSVHPHARHVDVRIAAQKAVGARGMKLHPTGQFIAPDDPKTVHLCARCGAHGLPVLFHCGPSGIEPKRAQERSAGHRYERMLAENLGTTFILGHSGARHVEQTVRFASLYPNAWYDLSCLGLGGIRTVLDAVPHERILFGTDWPFYHQSLTLARVLILTEGNEPLRRAILHDNAARLLGLTV